MISTRSVVVGAGCALLSLLPAFVNAQTIIETNSSGLGHGTREVYPTIAVIAGFFILAYSMYYSSIKAGGLGWRNHALWFFFNLLLALWGFFLIFGPDSLTSAGVAGGSNFNSPRCAIIGLQLIIQAAVGIFAIYAANAYASLAYALFGIFNALCLIGSNYLFNYNQPIWTLGEAQCNLYFQSTGDLQRCRDNGYLQVLRIFGMFAIFTEGYVILVSVLAYATAIPAYPGQNVAAPGHAAGYGTYGAPAGTTTTTGGPYNSGYAQATAGPGFVAQQAPPAGGLTTGVPTTTTQHTTYTTGPTTTVAH